MREFQATDPSPIMGRIGSAVEAVVAAGSEPAWYRRLTVSSLFAGSLLLSSALLFLIQPFFAKLVLPLLGGAPAVWITCSVFFQTMLLAGYAYAHLTTSWLGVKRQAILHSALLLAAALLLPPILRHDAATADLAQPILWLLSTLLITLGLPVFLLSASGPLLQQWFATTTHRGARDPYYLYGASNLGSLVALLGYPVLVEPRWPLTRSFATRAAEPEFFDRLRNQAALWSAGYLLLLILVWVCAIFVRPMRSSAVALPLTSESIAWPRRLRWLALAFVPSSLLLSVTMYLTTDIAPIPLLWVLPLALYLLTFILAFSRWPLVPLSTLRHLQPIIVLLLTLVLISEATEPVGLLVGLHMIGFLILSLICHGELARDRPPPQHLTEFYLWLALGGALGGIFNGLLAPLLFRGVVEYPLVLVLACLLRRPERDPTQYLAWPDALRPAALAVGTTLWLILVQWLGLPPGQAMLAVVFGPAAVVCYTFLARPTRFALGVAALFLASLFYHGVHGHTLHIERSFFGVHRVTMEPGGAFRQLIHGSTVHGRQRLDEESRLVPLTYYHPTGPIGRVFEAFSGRKAKKQIAVIGLGAGSLAAYAQPDQQWTFYEIDPAVARIAEDPRYFTFLSECRAPYAIRLGDARLTLADAPDASYGLLVVDAFSSDAIPLHLLTREALRLYLSKLAPDGILAFHVSNRYLRVERVLADLALDAGLSCYARDDLSLTAEERLEGKTPSQWVCLVRKPEHFGILTKRLWSSVHGRPDTPLWTDEYSNLFGIFKWSEEE